jgi:DNA-binding response OmpR family regulator
MNHRLIEAGLSSEGYRLLFAFNGEKGVELAVRESPDLVLLDVVMPIMDGFEVCRALRSMDKTADIPVIFITAMHQTTDKVEGFQAGGMDYITKPFDEDELKVRIQTHLKQYHQLKALAQRAKTPPADQDPQALDGSADSSGKLTPSQTERVLKAKALLVAELADPPSLKELATAVGCSQRQLNQEFKSLFGLPIITWLREYALRTSCQLLRETDLPIEHISGKVGYGSAANFSIAFKRRFNVTPREYRRNSR